MANINKSRQVSDSEDIRISDIVDTNPAYEDGHDADLYDLHNAQKDPNPVPLNGQDAYKIYTKNNDDKRVDESTDGLPADTPGHQGFDENAE